MSLMFREADTFMRPRSLPSGPK